MVEDAPLGPLTTIGTGGEASLLVTVETAEAAASVVRCLSDHETPFYCLGAGSDLLVADEGYQGAVMRLGESLCHLEDALGGTLADASRSQREAVASSELPVEDVVAITVAAGVPVPRLAAAVAEAGLAGLEFACGIPGSVGGGVATNAGAYGRCLADVLTEVQLATAEGVHWVAASQLEWEYRHCRLPAGVMVTAVRLELTRDDPTAIIGRQEDILEMRRAVQPQGVLTFGSTFKNPSGGAAGRLLDAAGLKGERRGGAEVSMAHANFVVNLGDARTADVLALMDHMRRRVHATSGVWLEPEVRLLGTGFPWDSSADDSRRSPSADG